MKTLYIGAQGNVGFDPETNEVFGLKSEREAISRVFLAKEPMHVVYEAGESHKEFDVKKDDIIVRFYDRTFENPIVVVKSKDWVKNLKVYNEAEEKAKEEWAQKQAENTCTGCEG